MSIKEEIEKPRQGFWKGQFSVEPIRPQIIYDVLFGIIAPILCFWFDPIVFQDSIAPNEGLLGRYKLIVYCFSTIAIGALFLWLFYGNRLQSYAGFLSGILFSGAVFSGGVGILLFPLSVLGLVVFIGVFGFIPFFTAFTYWRNGSRTFRQGKWTSSKRSFVMSFLLGVGLVCGIPAGTDLLLARMVRKAMTTLVSIDANSYEKDEAAATIRRLHWYVDVNQIVIDYFAESDEMKKDTLANAYRAITGQGINSSRYRD